MVVVYIGIFHMYEKARVVNVTKMWRIKICDLSYK